MLLILLLVAAKVTSAQGTSLDLLMAGNEYHQQDLPANAAGTWWVLHRSGGAMVLEALPAVVTPVSACGDDQLGAQSGRAVSVPAARDPVLLVRGHSALRAGEVRTALLGDRGQGDSARVEAAWGDQTLIVQHLTEPPAGERPGRYRIELIIDRQRFQLHADEWHGDGHWRVRWIGDLNRDGWPDLLVDASHKYSVHTTRLFLSREVGGRVEVSEAATFTHNAC